MKLHALIDADSKAILTWRLTGSHVADVTEFANLLQALKAPVKEVYADAAYFSQLNCREAQIAGATPYIKPKRHARPAAHKPTAFNDMVRAYQTDRTTWLRRYGRRNRVESTFGAIKRRLGGTLRALLDHARRIEACLKLLAWNLTRC